MSSYTSFIRPLTLLGILVALTFFLVPTDHADAQEPIQSATVNAPVDSGFSYSGRLTDNGNPADGDFDFQFILYDAATGGSQQGETLILQKVAVSKGLFNVQLDFGSTVFNGDARHLSVAVKPAGSNGGYVALSPRQSVGTTPYALRSEFGGRAGSYPYVVHMAPFGLLMTNICGGWVPDSLVAPEGTCRSLDEFLVGNKYYSPSATGFVAAANNFPFGTTDEARWGYSYTFFLSNPEGARRVQLPVSGCNDVILYTTDSEVAPDSIGSDSQIVYHRFPGQNPPELKGCPCADLNPTIDIPAGNFRLTATTRGGACTSYLSIGPKDPVNKVLPAGNWIQEADLELDWSSMRTYLGE